jgi:hypothetical protein
MHHPNEDVLAALKWAATSTIEIDNNVERHVQYEHLAIQRCVPRYFCLNMRITRSTTTTSPVEPA